MRLEIDGDVGTLTLDRPDALNAMSPEMIGELAVASAWLADRAPLRALIVTGAGRAFSAGGDVTWFRKGVEEPDFDLSPRRAPRRRGAASGDRRLPAHPLSGDRRDQRRPRRGGLLAGARCATSGSPPTRPFFVCAYGRIGASPDGGMTYFLPRIVGPARRPS